MLISGIISQILYLQKYCVSESREGWISSAHFTDFSEVLFYKQSFKLLEKMFKGCVSLKTRRSPDLAIKSTREYSPDNRKYRDF